MQPAKLSLNTVKLDVNYNLHCKYSHIVLLEAKARRLNSDHSQVFSIRHPNATPHISFKNFTWSVSQPITLKRISASIRSVYNPPAHTKSKTMLSPLPKLKRRRLGDLFLRPPAKFTSGRKEQE